MRQRPRFLFRVMLAAAVLAVAGDLRAETSALQMKRIEAPPVGQGYTSPTDYLYRATRPQHFFMQLGMPSGLRLARPDQGAEQFDQIVNKQPDEYVSPHPFRGVAKLGTEQYAFVVDWKAAESDPSADASDSEDQPEPPSQSLGGYARLYFDLNHNGDLTDDGVIEAASQREAESSSARYWLSYFPRVDLTLRADGTEYDYSFLLYVSVRESETLSYASASLSAAAYREGEITLNGRSRRVVLIDFDSNGRFDDQFKIREESDTPSEQVYAEYGDVLLLDPPSEAAGYSSPYDPTTSDYRHFMSKLINVDGRYHETEVTAAGDKLTMTPSSAPLGYVTNANDGFRAALYSDKGFVEVSGGQSEPVAVPEGDWKLLSYTIDQTRTQEAEQKDPDKEKEEVSLLNTLAKALSGAGQSAARARPRYTVISARATRGYEAVEVRAGKTVALPFGPPYKPIVKVAGRSSEGTVLLAMSLVGSGGEVCSSLVVDGGRPKPPEFTITTPDGEEVERGKFEYG